MQKLETRLKAPPLLFGAPRKVAALVTGRTACAALPLGPWQREYFYFSNSACVPLGQFGGNHHRFHNDLWSNSRPQEECEEAGRLIRMQSGREKGFSCRKGRGRGNTETNQQNQDLEKTARPKQLTKRQPVCVQSWVYSGLCTQAGVCVCMCVYAHVHVCALKGTELVGRWRAK